MSGADADAPAPPSDDGAEAEQLRACREAARRRLRERVGAIVRAVRAPLADVLRDHALVHLPPAAAARLRLVHPSWARALASPLFAVAHAAAPRRLSGLFFVAPPSASAAAAAGFLPLDAAADTVPSPPLAFLPSSSAPAVLSSSHGVACCYSPADDAYFVCNPATRSWQGVPCPPCRVTTRPRPAVVVVFDAGVYNFGGDFALVCAFESSPGSGIYCFAVFTSVAGAWWVADAVAPAEGLVPASGLAAGGTAWWRTTIGTAVGYNPVSGQVHLAVCPGDSDVVVFRLDGRGDWEVVATVSVAEILQQRPWQPQPALELTDSDDDAAEQERTGAIVTAAASRFLIPSDNDVRLLPFQGTEVEVVLLAGRRVVAFDTVARRRREAALPDQPAGTDWGAAAFAAHTNTLALVAPVVLMEPPDDLETC
ncbi:unnamed protein product [Urochloa decumbens]|uniref:F-box protein n=1 Tax=Urochloa decumbens TaxID=240449 RepID=A0ABC8XJJ7_9POAL